MKNIGYAGFADDQVRQDNSNIMIIDIMCEMYATQKKQIEQLKGQIISGAPIQAKQEKTSAADTAILELTLGG